MTTDWLPDDAALAAGAAVLVRAAAPPPVDERVVDVVPGAAATFDGDRVRGALVVSAPDPGPRERHARAELPAALAATRRLLREHDATVLRLGNRAALAAFRQAAAVGRIERRFAAAADAEGASLLTWTDREPRGDDGLYDAVVAEPPAGRDQSP